MPLSPFHSRSRPSQKEGMKERRVEKLKFLFFLFRPLSSKKEIKREKERRKSAFSIHFPYKKRKKKYSNFSFFYSIFSFSEGRKREGRRGGFSRSLHSISISEEIEKRRKKKYSNFFFISSALSFRKGKERRKKTALSHRFQIPFSVLKKRKNEEGRGEREKIER